MREWSVFILVFVASMAGVYALTAFLGKVGCENLSEQTGLPTKHVTLTCYVKVKGQWVPEQNWRPVGE